METSGISCVLPPSIAGAPPVSWASEPARPNLLQVKCETNELVNKIDETRKERVIDMVAQGVSEV
jgi:hypothetical protein